MDRSVNARAHPYYGFYCENFRELLLRNMIERNGRERERGSQVCSARLAKCLSLVINANKNIDKPDTGSLATLCTLLQLRSRQFTTIRSICLRERQGTSSDDNLSLN